MKPQQVRITTVVLIYSVTMISSILVMMTWALIELARHPNVQTKLREELLSFGGEPSYDQLTTGFPYLDAVVQETLRVHSAVQDLIRQVRRQVEISIGYLGL
ncbi:cytochrome P450, partial [Pisolithus thermaeus]